MSHYELVTLPDDPDSEPLDPYGHPIVVHAYPNRQDDVYRPLIGDRSKLTGVSLQNSDVSDTHWQVVKWVRESEQAGKPWVVAFDESGNATHGQPPDLGYKGFDGRDRRGEMAYTEHRVRRETLWGTLLGGGAGVEYCFGYQFVENDLVYVANGDTTSLDLSEIEGRFTVMWLNPRTGGELARGSVEGIEGGGKRDLGTPPVGSQRRLARRDPQAIASPTRHSS